MPILQTLLEKFQGVLEYSVPTIVLLGFLIFVHELGHFLIAKYNKVRVETFSLGFGPKVFKFKWGETTYALSAIPLGGYVKMFGDDPSAKISEEDKKHSFMHKPLRGRIAVVLAGPLMNFFFAIVIYTVMSMYGEQAVSPVVGDIETKSDAYQSGFRSGDKIVKIAQEPMKTWEEVQSAIETNGGQKIAVEVQREGTGENATLTVAPNVVENHNILSWQEKVGEVSGLNFSSKVPFIGVSDLESPAYKAGLRTGDLITEVNGAKVEHWRDLSAALAKADKQVQLKVEHDAATAEKEPPTADVTIPTTGDMAALGIESGDVFLAELEKDSPAFKAGMQKSDKIVSIDDKPVANFDDIASTVRGFTPDKSKALVFGVIREGKSLKIPAQPLRKERANAHGNDETRFEIGIKPLISTTQGTFSLVADNPFAAFKRGLYLTGKWTSATVLSFVRLVQARISPKNIGGFFSIGIMAKRSWQIGFSQYLSTMGILSLNLFILNLLPIPVLDGGHLLFYTIEFAQGAPLSLRKMELAQQVGMILLLLLMVFAMFNDITRMLS